MIPIPRGKQAKKQYFAYCRDRINNKDCLEADTDDPANIFLLIKHKNYHILESSPFLDHEERTIIIPEEHKNDYSGRFHKYYTPVNYAVYLGDIPMVELLVIKGADLNQGALNIAIQQEDFEMIEYLLDKEIIDVHHNSAQWCKIYLTPFEEALESYNIDIIDILDIYDSQRKKITFCNSKKEIDQRIIQVENDELISNLSKSWDKFVYFIKKITP